MKAHWEYLKYVLRHKWYVYHACRGMGLGFWQSFIHDWHKFLPGEWFPYVDYFYGENAELREIRDETGYYKPTDTSNDAFDFAWLLHQKRGRHHWQWWILPDDDGGVKVLDMPLKYRREMLADWRGAGKAQGHGNDVFEWYDKNKGKMQLHPDTRLWIEYQLGYNRSWEQPFLGEVT